MADQPNMFYFGVFWRVLKNTRYFFVMGCLCIGLTFISAGFVYLSKIFYNYERKIIIKKIMVQQFYINKDNTKKKKKNKNKKIKKEDNKNAKKELIKEENPDN